MPRSTLKFFVLAIAFAVFLGLLFFVRKPQPSLETKFALPEEPLPSEYSYKINEPAEFQLLKATRHVYQTFNNCGPATLSMILSWWGITVSQSQLGDAMRPYQNAKGDNDDKTIFVSELASWAEKYGFATKTRVNGDIDTLKRFTANGIPVVVKTWLKVNEDIGHFRIVRGFDEAKRVVIQDDSYHGPNKKISYFDFLSMWQPFNYGYIIVYPREKEEIILAILGEEGKEKVAYENALARAQKEKDLTPDNIYPVFNLATSYFYLEEYQKSVEAYEAVEGRLPRRMLWYQIEPILAYQKLRNYDRVFEITNKILNSGNRAFSELYQIRGEIYLEQEQKDLAKREFELARQYNKNYQPAQEALKAL